MVQQPFEETVVLSDSAICIATNIIFNKPVGCVIEFWTYGCATSGEHFRPIQSNWSPFSIPSGWYLRASERSQNQHHYIIIQYACLID